MILLAGGELLQLSFCFVRENSMNSSVNDIHSHISCSTRGYHGDYVAHTHAYSQVLLGLTGCLELEVEGRRARVDGVTGLVVPAGTRHSYYSDECSQVYVINASEQHGLNAIRPFRQPQWDPTVDPVDILVRIGCSPRILQRRRMHPDTLSKVVIQSLNEAWPVARMASFFGFSVPQFHRRWKELTDETPQAWIRRIRLDEAQVLLRSERSLEVAAARVGYRSASALCFALRRDRGTSARQLHR